MVDHDVTAELRRHGRARRAAIPADEQIRRAADAAQQIRDLPEWRDARRIAGYRAFGSELDVAPMAERSGRSDVEVFVPVLDGDHLRFASTTATSWAPNRFGIPEPVGVPTIGPEELDLVIVAAVAVDRNGGRVGMGGGFYDRTFGWLCDLPRPSTPYLVAAVHAEQLVPTIPRRPWDVVMDAIVTPDELIVISTSS